MGTNDGCSCCDMIAVTELHRVVYDIRQRSLIRKNLEEVSLQNVVGENEKASSRKRKAEDMIHEHERVFEDLQ